MLMRQYYVVENNDKFSDEYFDYMAGPFTYDSAQEYIYIRRHIAKIYGYKIVYRDIEVQE